MLRTSVNPRTAQRPSGFEIYCLVGCHSSLAGSRLTVIVANDLAEKLEAPRFSVSQDTFAYQHNERAGAL